MLRTPGGGASALGRAGGGGGGRAGGGLLFAAAQRRCGITELIIAVLMVSLFFSLLGLKRLEEERDEWKDRLLLTLRSTSDVARASEVRLQKTMTIMREGDARGGDLATGESNDVNTGNSNPKVASLVERDVNKPKSIPEEGQAVADDSLLQFDGSTTVIIFCYNRAQYLSRTLDSLKSRLGTVKRFKEKGLRIIVSQDGYDESVQQAARKFVNEVNSGSIKAQHIQHPHYDASKERHMAAYYSLSMHYLKGLELAFADGSQRVIILEDDLELAVDFFPFFETFAGMLDKDESLLAVSAWNDHGQSSHVADSERLYRSDFFPGLGWMMPLRIWQELKPKWPLAFWDDWLRLPNQRKGRHIIHPEVSRTITFGVAGGASRGQFFDQFLGTMRLNDVPVAFSTKHVKLMDKQVFDEWFMTAVNKATRVSSVDLMYSDKEEYRVEYVSLDQYPSVARSLGMIDDVKDGVPRGAYRGIVPVRYRGKQVYVTPTNIAAVA